MAVVVVGGHTRNIGKTSVMAGLIAGLPERRWTAFKITQFGHGVCSADGAPCDCETADHTIAISEERASAAGPGEGRVGASGRGEERTDSARFLEAGAARSFWVRTRQGQLAEAMPRLRRLLAEAGDAIIESNSVLRFMRPDVFVSVLDAGTPDFKPSARRYLDRADAIVLTGGAPSPESWAGVSLGLIERAAHFSGTAPEFCGSDLLAFVRARLNEKAPIA